MVQLEVSKPEPTKSFVELEGLKLFNHNFLVIEKRISCVIFQNLSVFLISSFIECKSLGSRIVIAFRYVVFSCFCTALVRSGVNKSFWSKFFLQEFFVRNYHKSEYLKCYKFFCKLVHNNWFFVFYNKWVFNSYSKFIFNIDSRLNCYCHIIL